jgi:hypothetical protein
VNLDITAILVLSASGRPNVLEALTRTKSRMRQKAIVANARPGTTVRLAAESR